MSKEFVKFCNQCYELFYDPVLYQEHVEQCGKVQEKPVEPAQVSTMNVTDCAIGKEPDGVANQDEVENQKDEAVPDGATLPDGQQPDGATPEGTTESVNVPEEPPPQPRSRIRKTPK